MLCQCCKLILNCTLIHAIWQDVMLQYLAGSSLIIHWHMPYDRCNVTVASSSFIRHWYMPHDIMLLQQTRPSSDTGTCRMMMQCYCSKLVLHQTLVHAVWWCNVTAANSSFIRHWYMPHAVCNVTAVKLILHQTLVHATWRCNVTVANSSFIRHWYMPHEVMLL